jgi:hypothetical protein
MSVRHDGDPRGWHFGMVDALQYNVRTFVFEGEVDIDEVDNIAVC